MRESDTVLNSGHLKRCLSGLGSVLTTLVLFGTSTPASASVIYSYQGNNFDAAFFDDTPPAGSFDTSMAVSGFFEMATPLLPNITIRAEAEPGFVRAEFTDGRSTVTSADFDLLFISVSTDSNGEIDEWFFSIRSPDAIAVGGQVATILSNFSSSTDDFDGGVLSECVSLPCDLEIEGDFSSDQGGVFENPGTWTIIPEPSTASLLALGLIGLEARRRGTC